MNMSTTAMIDVILAAGLSVQEHPNNSGQRIPNHYTLIGGIRPVDFWTTGTIKAPAVPHEFKKLKDKLFPFSLALTTAIRVAKTGGAV